MYQNRSFIGSQKRCVKTGHSFAPKRNLRILGLALKRCIKIDHLLGLEKPSDFGNSALEMSQNRTFLGAPTIALSGSAIALTSN